MLFFLRSENGRCQLLCNLQITFWREFHHFFGLRYWISLWNAHFFLIVPFQQNSKGQTVFFYTLTYHPHAKTVFISKDLSLSVGQILCWFSKSNDVHRRANKCNIDYLTIDFRFGNFVIASSFTLMQCTVHVHSRWIHY